jgi:hypothetical protein
VSIGIDTCITTWTGLIQTHDGPFIYCLILT